MVVSLSQEPTAQYVEEFSTVIVDGRSEQQVVLPISSGAYIAPGSIFIINITEAELQNLEGLLCYPSNIFVHSSLYYGDYSSAQEGSGPEVSSPTELVVTTDVANALIGFDTNSLIATVDDGKTPLHECIRECSYSDNY